MSAGMLGDDTDMTVAVEKVVDDDVDTEMGDATCMMQVHVNSSLNTSEPLYCRAAGGLEMTIPVSSDADEDGRMSDVLDIRSETDTAFVPFQVPSQARGLLCASDPKALDSWSKDYQDDENMSVEEADDTGSDTDYVPSQVSSCDSELYVEYADAPGDASCDKSEEEDEDELIVPDMDHNCAPGGLHNEYNVDSDSTSEPDEPHSSCPCASGATCTKNVRCTCSCFTGTMQRCVDFLEAHDIALLRDLHASPMQARRQFIRTYVHIALEGHLDYFYRGKKLCRGMFLHMTNIGKAMVTAAKKEIEKTNTAVPPLPREGHCGGSMQTEMASAFLRDIAEERAQPHPGILKQEIRRSTTFMTTSHDRYVLTSRLY